MSPSEVERHFDNIILLLLWYAIIQQASVFPVDMMWVGRILFRNMLADIFFC